MKVREELLNRLPEESLEADNTLTEIASQEDLDSFTWRQK